MIRGEGLYDLKVRAKEDGEWKFFSMVSDFDKQNGEMDVAVLFNSLDRMEQRYEARTATRWTGVKDLAGEEIYFMDLVQEQSPGGNGRVFLVAGTDEKRGQVIITAVSGSVLIANPPLCEMKKIGDYYDEKFAGLFSTREKMTERDFQVGDMIEVIDKRCPLFSRTGLVKNVFLEHVDSGRVICVLVKFVGYSSLIYMNVERIKKVEGNIDV